MKLICDGLDLSDAVLKVVKAVSSKAVNPALECIKLKARENYLLLTATDTELTIEKKIKADIMAEGEILVSGRLFSEFVKKLVDSSIELNLTGGQLKINYMDSEGVFSVLPASEFPKLPGVAGQGFNIDTKDLRELITKVSFAASRDDSRPILKGILITTEADKITAVALDGFRLAICNRKLKNIPQNNARIIVPERILTEISKFLTDDKAVVTVGIDKSHIIMNVDNVMITARLLEGEFINYSAIVNVKNDKKITVSKPLLENSLERAAILFKNTSNNLVKCDVREKTLLITSNSEAGNIKETVAVKYEGQDILIAFNSRYLLDVLKSVADEFININIDTPFNPCTITPIKGDDYLYLVLPVRIFG